ncbi:MAG: cupin, partial [Hyphomicrobium sp.]|nr:cupin [Hyphomicrobium sp.]
RSASPEVRRSASPEVRRSASTAIYFLLPAGVVSRWHRVDAAEVWHWYAGASLRLSVAGDGAEEGTSIVLGCNLVSGERPQAVVRAGQWQQAESLGDWTLVGCTVAPGFAFSGFEIAASGWSPRRL